MTRLLISVFCRSLLPALLALSGTAASAQESNDDIYGVWKITATVGSGIEDLTLDEANKLIGKPVLISPERFEFNGNVCLHPDYNRSEVDPSTYFDSVEGYVGKDVSDIPFPSPVTEIDTGFPHCNLLFLIRDDDLVIAVGASFFEAVRTEKFTIEYLQRFQQ
jgi:hypothetical protein